VVLGEVQEAGAEVEPRLLPVREALVAERLDLLVRRRSRVLARLGVARGVDLWGGGLAVAVTSASAGAITVTRTGGRGLRRGLGFSLGLGHGRMGWAWPGAAP